MSRDFFHSQIAPLSVLIKIHLFHDPSLFSIQASSLFMSEIFKTSARKNLFPSFVSTQFSVFNSLSIRSDLNESFAFYSEHSNVYRWQNGLKSDEKKDTKLKWMWSHWDRIFNVHDCEHMHDQSKRLLRQVQAWMSFTVSILCKHKTVTATLNKGTSFRAF